MNPRYRGDAAPFDDCTPSATDCAHGAVLAAPKHDFSLATYRHSQPIKVSEGKSSRVLLLLTTTNVVLIRTYAWKSALGSTRKTRGRLPLPAPYHRRKPGKRKLHFCTHRLVLEDLVANRIFRHGCAAGVSCPQRANELRAASTALVSSADGHWGTRGERFVTPPPTPIIVNSWGH